MSDINEIKKDNEQLDQALSYVRSQRPHDEANQSAYIEMEKKYKIELAPLQKEFSEKLKEYTELSQKYYGEYVPISSSQNKERRSTWNKQMGDYESYNASSEIERRQNVQREQSTWNEERNKLNGDYQTALDEYEVLKNQWEGKKSERKRILDEAIAGVNSAKSKREQWNNDHDPDYLKNVAAEYARRFNTLMISSTSRENTRTLDIQYLKNLGLNTVKRVAVVDAANSGNAKRFYGIVGPDNSKRVTVNGGKKSVLVRVGRFGRDGVTPHHKINSSTVRMKLPYKDPEVDYLKNEGNPSDKSVHGMNTSGRRAGFGFRDRFEAKILTHDRGNGNIHLEVKRVDRPNIGWGQDLRLWIKVESDKTSLDGPRGRIHAKTIWGSGFKPEGPVRQIVFPNNFLSQIPGMDDVDRVPRWINYPMGDWGSTDPFHDQEDGIASAMKTERIYYTLFNVDYEDIAEYQGKGEEPVLWALGAADDKAFPLLNTLSRPSNGSSLNRGWGGRPNTYRMNGTLHAGPNTIFIIHKNTGGAGGVCMAFLIGNKDGPDFTKMVASTGPNWLAFRAWMNIPTLNTRTNLSGYVHTGAFSTIGRYGVGDGLRQMGGANSYLPFNPIELVNALKDKNLIQPVEGSYGVQVHNYDPPTAKVQTIRIKLASLPPARKITFKQFQIFSTDRYDENAARQGSVSVSSSKLDNRSLPLTTLVDGNTTNNQNAYFVTSSEVPWKEQYVEFRLNNPIKVFKAIIYGDVGTGPYLSQLMVEMRDREGKIIFSGAPLGGSGAVKHELYFNSPVIPEGAPNPPDRPTKKNISRDFPVYTPGKVPAYPIMPAYITPNEELLNKLIMMSDELITLNLRIQEVYKKYTMDNHIDNYQFSVLGRRRDLLTEVESLIAHRKKLDKKIGDYTATRKNQIDQERRASSSQIHLWIWGCVSILVFTVGFTYLLYPSKMYYTPQIIAWGIILLVTSLTTMFIGGSITYMLWLFIVLNIFFYLYKTRYG